MTPIATGPTRTRGRTVGLLIGLTAMAALIALVVASSGSARARGSCDNKPATITGTNGSNTIRLTVNKDVVDAMGGNDTIQASSTKINHGKDIICGGIGNDKLIGNNENNILIGGPGNDDVNGAAGNDLVVGDNANPKGPENGPTGSDVVNGNGGRDFVVGDNFAEGNATGASADKSVVGLDAADKVIGDDASLEGNATGGKDDHVAGADGDDLIVGDSYAPHGTASGSGDDEVNAGPGDDVEVGDNYTVNGSASGGGKDKLAGPDGGDLGLKCKPHDPCDDTFYGDNYVASCASSSKPAAQKAYSVIKCVEERGPGGAADKLTPDQRNDFMNGGPPNPSSGDERDDADTCAGGSGTDTATRCHRIKTGAEHLIPYP